MFLHFWKIIRARARETERNGMLKKRDLRISVNLVSVESTKIFSQHCCYKHYKLTICGTDMHQCVFVCSIKQKSSCKWNDAKNVSKVCLHNLVNSMYMSLNSNGGRNMNARFFINLSTRMYETKKDIHIQTNNEMKNKKERVIRLTVTVRVYLRSICCLLHLIQDPSTISFNVFLSQMCQ